MTAAVVVAEPTWEPVPGSVWLALRTFIEPYVGARFVVPGEPAPKKRRIGKGRGAFTPAATIAAEKRVKDAFAAALPGWEPEPDRTYGCLVQFRTGPGSLIDVDNGCKLVLDALNKVFWQDDIQVGGLFINLVRGGGEPGTEVLLFAVEPNGTKTTRLCACGTRYRTVKKMCADCERRRSVVNALLADDDSAADAAEQLGRDRRAVFSYITARMIGSNAAPSIVDIAGHTGLTAHRARAVVDTLTSDGYLGRAGRRLKILKPLGDAR